MQEKFVIHEGDRVRLLRDLPDEAVPLKAGMLGTVEKYHGYDDLGVRFDGHEGVSFRRDLNGQRVFVIDYCELVDKPKLDDDTIPLPKIDVEDAGPALAISGILESARHWGNCSKCGKIAEVGNATGYCSDCLDSLVAPKPEAKKLTCGSCGGKEAVDPATWECEFCGVSFLVDDDEMEAEDCVICGSAADTTIAVCKECAQEVSGDLPEVDYKGIEAQLAKILPVRFEIKTVIQDLSEDLGADNSLSQCLNEGWEILELSHHVVDELDGETIIREYRRIVTLRRAVSAVEFTIGVGGDHPQRLGFWQSQNVGQGGGNG